MVEDLVIFPAFGRLEMFKTTFIVKQLPQLVRVAWQHWRLRGSYHRLGRVKCDRITQTSDG
jgi:hypothetical protein